MAVGSLVAGDALTDLVTRGPTVCHSWLHPSAPPLTRALAWSLVLLSSLLLPPGRGSGVVELHDAASRHSVEAASAVLLSPLLWDWLRPEVTASAAAGVSTLERLATRPLIKWSPIGSHPLVSPGVSPGVSLGDAQQAAARGRAALRRLCEDRDRSQRDLGASESARASASQARRAARQEYRNSAAAGDAAAVRAAKLARRAARRAVLEAEDAYRQARAAHRLASRDARHARRVAAELVGASMAARAELIIRGSSGGGSSSRTQQHAALVSQQLVHLAVDVPLEAQGDRAVLLRASGCGNLACKRVHVHSASWTSEQAHPLLLCTGCLAVAYCCIGCQRSHWGAHKLVCRAAQRRRRRG
jgi:hypothetical protein